MHPILFHIGGIPVFSYGVLVATGVLLSLWWGRRIAPQVGVDPEKLWNMGIYMVLAALLIAKVWLILSDWSFYAANPREIFSVNTFQSGGTFYGGLVGSIGTIILYTYFQKMNVLRTFDVCTASLPLGHSIGRLGCFAAGCCYGKPTSVPWSVVFSNPVAAQIAGTPLGIHIHPTQLYESFLELCNFFVLMWLWKRQRFAGQIFGAYMILYGVERGIIEFFRGDPGRTLMFHDRISLMQVTSIVMILAGSLLWWRGLRGRPSAHPLRPATSS
jgi:phosphatidylglycerol---prolipoprotein diacylglyceryl transferase